MTAYRYRCKIPANGKFEVPYLPGIVGIYSEYGCFTARTSRYAVLNRTADLGLACEALKLKVALALFVLERDIDTTALHPGFSFSVLMSGCAFDKAYLGFACITGRTDVGLLVVGINSVRLVRIILRQLLHPPRFQSNTPAIPNAVLGLTRSQP